MKDKYSCTYKKIYSRYFKDVTLIKKIVSGHSVYLPLIISVNTYLFKSFRTNCFHFYSFCDFRSLLSAIMLYSTVFSTKMKEGVNQTEIATLLTEDGYANTGLTFQWYICVSIYPPLPNSVPCEYSSLPGERIGKSRRFTFFRKTDFQNSPFRLGLQEAK